MDTARPIVGTADHYARAVEVFRARAEALHITFESLDTLCGFAQGFTGKLLTGSKTMSVFSFFTLARGLGLLPAFMHDEAQLRALTQRADWITSKRKGSKWRPRKISGGATRFVIYSDFYRKIGRAGALAWHAKRIRRRNAARKAAMARWGSNGAV
jgi:hypothetical protein